MATHDLEDAVTASDGGSVVAVRVTPGADATAVPSGFDEWRGTVEARVAAPARDGAANEALLGAFAELTGADCRLASGATSREKRVRVAAPPDAVLAVLRDGLDVADAG
jgi:hypothetical protein